MADAELSGGDLDVLTGANLAVGDKLYGVDISNTAGVHSDASGTSIVITAAELAIGLKPKMSLVKADVGLGNVDNTADASKVLAESQITGLVTDLAAKQPLDSDLTAIAALDASTAGAIASDGAGWIKKTYAQFKTALGLVKGDVGLGSVDNTADTAKAIAGDVSGTLGASTVDKIKGSAVDVTAPTVAQTFLWDDVAAKWVPKSHSGDVTIDKAGVTAIGAGKVTLAMQANAAANSIRGNITGSPATPIDMTVAQAKTLLAITESDVANLVADLGLKAPLASPTFTGTVTLPAGTALRNYATRTYIRANFI